MGDELVDKRNVNNLKGLQSNLVEHFANATEICVHPKTILQVATTASEAGRFLEGDIYHYQYKRILELRRCFGS